MIDSIIKCNTAMGTLTRVCEIYGLRLITETLPLDFGVIASLYMGVIIVNPTASDLDLSTAADYIVENMRVKEGTAA